MKRQITVGTVKIGGGAPISIQSMTNTDTRDVEATCAQIRALEAAGCEIIRLGIPDEDVYKRQALDAAEQSAFVHRILPESLLARYFKQKREETEARRASGNPHQFDLDTHFQMI